MATPLAAGQAHGAFSAVAKGLACYEDAVDPRFELGGNGEVVHRRADDHDVGGEEFLEHGLASG